jgi:hypothetical protein
MLLGEIVRANLEPVYTRVWARGADAAAFVVEALQVSGSFGLPIDVEHKNSEDSSWAVAGSLPTLTAVGISAETVSGLKEQVRLKLTVNGVGGWIRVLIHEPMWR